MNKMSRAGGVKLLSYIFCGLFFSLFFKEGDSFFWSPSILVATLVIILCNINNIGISPKVFEYLKACLVFISLGCLYYVFPLGSDYIRVDDPFAFFDSQKYALSAQMTIEEGAGLGHWLSIGIERYIIIIYRVFGINEVNVVAINGLVFIASVTVFSNIISRDGSSRYSVASFMALVPLTFFYAIQPSKEILSVALVAAFIGLMASKTITNRTKKFVLYSLLFSVAIFIRINLAIFLIIFLLVSQLRFSRWLFFQLAFTVIIVCILIYVVSLFSIEVMGVGVDFWLDKMQSLLDPSLRLQEATKNNHGTASASYAVKMFLSPDNRLLSIILIPIKMIFVWVSPFPFFKGVFSLPLTGAESSVYALTLLTSLSAVLNFLLLPAIFMMFIKFNGLNDSSKLVFVFVVSYLALIAFAYPTQFTRHRVLIEIPMYMLFIKHFGLWLPLYLKFVYITATIGFAVIFLVMLSVASVVGL